MAERTGKNGTQDRPITATVDGNRLELIESGEARFAAILEMIAGAEESLRVIFYQFADDSSGRQIRDALANAAARGVAVKVLLDGFGSGDTDAAFFQQLEDKGCDYCVFHPSYGRRYLLRNHQKLVVADGCRALIGGGNIKDTYLSDSVEGRWRDLWLRIDGPKVRTAVDYFDSTFRWSTRPHSKLKTLRRLIHEHSEFRGVLQWKFSSPLSLRKPWPSSVAKDIAKAERLDIVAAYFSPPRSMLRRIGAAARRGQVRIITAAKSDNHATIAAARHTYSRLLRKGVEMYEYLPCRLHTKLIIVDDVTYIGSANFDFRSSYINLELMLRIRDSDFADRMRGYFEGEMADSEQITVAKHRKRASPWRRLKWTLSHFLVTTMDYTVTRRLNFSPEA